MATNHWVWNVIPPLPVALDSLCALFQPVDVVILPGQRSGLAW
jgi:hypothetical protein